LVVDKTAPSSEIVVEVLLPGPTVLLSKVKEPPSCEIAEG
jgi:hypothetical protein